MKEGRFLWVYMSGESRLCDAEEKSPLAPMVHSLYVWPGIVPTRRQSFIFYNGDPKCYLFHKLPISLCLCLSPFRQQEEEL